MSCTLLSARKNWVYVITQVDRATRCVVSYGVAYVREPRAFASRGGSRAPGYALILRPVRGLHDRGLLSRSS